MAKFLICNLCGNIVGMVKEGGGTLSCCNQNMNNLVANTVEASTEKHLPEVTKTENGVKVQVGSVLHPMEEAHYIDFIYVKTDKGGHRAALKPGDAPEAEFCFVNEKPLEVYEYCNLHGLWKVEL
ncbi:MAG: desulfoferrodoxin [Defluviitaleaceae bacterium]|nr:desulfoferrodoxin [Defluviitaleaceae bacterium]